MRRPLCMMSLVFLITQFLLLTIWPLPVYNDDTLNGQVIIVTGWVYQKEIRKEKSVIYLKNASIEAENSNNTTIENQKKQELGIIVYLSEKANEISELPPIGERVKVSGRKVLFEPPTNPGQFDMGRYYQIRQIDYSLLEGKILASDRNYNIYLETLSEIRSILAKSYDSILNESDSAIVKAMVLGDKTALDSATNEMYQKNGLSHILAISGLHISFIGLGLLSVMKKAGLSFGVSAGLSGFLMISYAIMTGFGVSAIRAVIMFLLSVLAECLGRTCDMLTSLSVASILILLSQPLYIYDPGFLLSFGAILGMGLLVPPLQTVFPSKNKILNTLKVSLGISVFTFPLTIYFFYQFPIYSVFLNIIMIPPMSALLLIALAAGFGGLLSVTGGRLFAIPCHLILWFCEKGCEINEKLTGAYCITGKPAIWKVGVYYCLIIILFFAVGKIKRKSRKKISMSACIILCCSFLIWHQEKGLMITFMDVGQGDGILLRYQNKMTCMIDGGSTDCKNVGKYRIIPFLKSQGVDRLDYLFVTHADNDHVSGVKEVMEASKAGGVRVVNLVLPDMGMKDEEYENLVRIAKNNKIKCLKMSAGDRIQKDELMLTCLHPDSDFRAQERNGYSMVLEISYKDFQGLFTGDISIQEESAIWKRMVYKDYDFLKIAHHGSEKSTSTRFLERIRPYIAIISCGADNKYGHPHPALLARLRSIQSKIYVTKEMGAVSLWTDGEKIQVDCFNENMKSKGR